MRGRKPRREKHRIVSLCLLESFELPGSVIEIVEVIANLHRDAVDFGNCLCGLHATSHRTRVDCEGLPAAGDALGNGNGLCTSLGGEFERLATSKPCWHDAFHVTVANE